MFLLIAIAVLTLAVGIGGWLGGLYLMLDTPPKRLAPGLLHGAFGLAGVALLILGLSRPLPLRHAVKMGAGGFGYFAAFLLCAAAVAGLALLITRLRHRPPTTPLIATHGMLAICGYILLLTFLTMLH